MKKADIAKQFQLPERQSKLVTMLREEGLKDEQVYCICRSSDVTRFMIGCDRCEEWYHGDCINVTEQESARIRKFYCKRCKEKHPGLQNKYKQKKHRSDEHSKKHSDNRKHDRHSSHRSKKDKKREKCGECEACYIREDCGRCEPCKDKPKFGGQGVLGQKCKKRQCINFFHMAKKHSSHSRSDHTYNTENPAKKPRYRSPSPKPKARSRSKSPVASPPVAVTKRERSLSEQSDDAWKPNILRDKNDGSDDDLWAPKQKKPWPKDVKQKKKKDTLSRPKKKPRYESSSDSDEGTMPVSYEQKQCFGPQCIRAAQIGSKYCSDACGMKLAEARIYSVLPQRIQEWKMTPCQAEENDRKLLENIRNQQQTAREKLKSLDHKHKELDALLSRVKAVTHAPEADVEEDEVDYTVYCVTCGHEVASRRAVKHMHHCYNKLESQMTFGSMFKTRIEGNNMFCDFFNPVNQSYCKRLRVMCPEHVKEPKISNTEVCGFPLTENLFDETSEVCRASKKKCIRHYCWDKLRRANIDMERVGQCLKLDELIERERQIRTAITNRAGVLGLMLHSTYNHHLAERLQQMHQKSSESPTKGATPKASPAKPKPIQSDHHYHRSQVPTPKKIIKVIPVKTVDQGRQLHDHQYFNSHQSVDTKRHHDHMYFSKR